MNSGHGVSHGKPGAAAPLQIDGWGSQDTASDLNQGIGTLNVEDEEEDDGGGVSLSENPEEPPRDKSWNEHVEGEEMKPYESVEEDNFSTKGEPETTKSYNLKLIYAEIDDAFWKAFLYAVHQSRQIHNREKKP